MSCQSNYVPTYGALMATWLDQKGEMANLPEKAGHLHVTRNILREHVAAVEEMAEQQLEALDKAEDYITRLEMENRDMSGSMRQMENTLESLKLKAVKTSGEDLLIGIAKAEQRNRWLEIENQRVRNGAQERIRWLEIENQRLRDKLGEIDRDRQGEQDRVEAVNPEV